MFRDTSIADEFMHEMLVCRLDRLSSKPQAGLEAVANKTAECLEQTQSVFPFADGGSRKNHRLIKIAAHGKALLRNRIFDVVNRPERDAAEAFAHIRGDRNDVRLFTPRRSFNL